MTSFANIARTTGSTKKFIYYDALQIIVKTTLMLKFCLQNSLQNFESLFLIWCDKLPIYGNLK